MKQLPKANRGFVLGKFMPPHKGHVFLCEFARLHCEKLTILVGSMPDEPIPGALRFEWMKKLFPTCNVVWCDEVLPQEPVDENDTEFWYTWTDVVKRYTGTDLYDTVYASEPYGMKLANCLGATFVPCDMMRQTVPTSGTTCRETPTASWDFLPDVVKPYFTKRVTLFGPESTGKSTLADALGEYYKTVVVPEYGRTYTEVFGADVGAPDLLKIAMGHMASVKAAAPLANRGLLIEDTDPVMTAVWSEMLTGQRDPWFEGFDDYADLYLLCSPDIPWVNDGTRYFENDADRRRFFDICETELLRRGVKYAVIYGGGHGARFDRATHAIKNYLGIER